MNGEPTLDLSQTYRGVREEAHEQIVDHFTRMLEQRRALRREDREIEDLATAALRRQLHRDEQYAAQIGPLISASADRFTNLEVGDHVLAGLSREKILALTTGCTVRDLQVELGNVVAVTAAKDTSVRIFTPPYADEWTHTDGGRHQQLFVSAQKASGSLQMVYSIGKEGGSAYLGAGVAILFMRQAPGHPPGHGPAGLAQIRTDTPYRYRWRDVSYAGTAHQHGGFGVLVGSWSTAGGPGRVDQNHQRWAWNDGTNWYKTHSNPNWSGLDDDTALRFGDQSPYFPIEPGRLYVAWVWCFLDGDAGGADVLSAAFAQAQIVAAVNTIVVGQQ
ncbi:MAG TPA: hypothetical protein VIW24_31810 [Aldersonia sp.]